MATALGHQPVAKALQFSDNGSEFSNLSFRFGIQGPVMTQTTRNLLPTSIPAHRSMTASIISFLLADEKPTKETKLFHGRKSSSQRCIDVGRIRLRIGVFATNTPATHSRPQTQFSSSEMAAGSAAMGN